MNKEKTIQVVTKDKKELELTMKEPLTLHMMAIDGIDGEVSREVNLIATLCEVDVNVIASLPLKEYQKLSKQLQGFLS